MKLSIATSAGFASSLAHETTPFIARAGALELSMVRALPDGNYRVLEESTFHLLRVEGGSW
jgi:hypothetical protein